MDRTTVLIALMVVACPGAFILATPTAMVAGFAVKEQFGAPGCLMVKFAAQVAELSFFSLASVIVALAE